MRRQPLIIGAGPAGTAAAITLGRAEQRPVLIERTVGPSDKVCGDFLSADTILRARALGCDPGALGAAPISRVRLFHGVAEAAAVLPFPALSLSRRLLDQALLDLALQAGVELVAGQTVRQLTFDQGQWVVQADSRHIAETVFLATGKHDLRDHPRPKAGQGAVGLKMYFALSPAAKAALAGATELTLFPGGYAGLQPVENGRAALCVAVGAAAFRAVGGTWAKLLAAIGQATPRFGEMLDGAVALLPRPLAVAGIPYGFLRRERDALFRLGDQAAVIPSLTGDGMAIALHSGQAAAEIWLAGGDAMDYQRTLTRTLAPQMRLARLLHRACMTAPLQAMAVRGAGLFPALLSQAARWTRLRQAVLPPPDPYLTA